ncbi:AAC(3) family N-acetyltransferase [Streptomyces sp. AV19]|uniref:aminoglycoside N(3)-acetyltransferase n=1 Tax=Streptomyces sp. AV19 TaxID=2793068 RepID=UPI0018FE034E|nr:AAC(3) family N-acetyltransferase [Streptomyces sp. AV19]MBH1934307.1 AAC(3) family N-acetyltransferase [Streptomyces sp. AV19]MDG4533385.1 AAC(3) family N-acetyltransferase [Streptomyces sp. AV19]
MNPSPVSGPLCTRDSLAADLRAAGAGPGRTLLVHSSLASLGWVAGGPVAVVRAFLDVLGPEGTLVVPTMTGDNSDPAEWGNPPVPEQWWPAIRDVIPAYDPRVSRSFGMGVIAETVRCWPGAVRSAHPQASFAALGPRAREVSDGHAPDSLFGESSPLARLEEAGAHVLLLGVGFDVCSCFHLAEYRVPHPLEDVSFAARTEAGRTWTTVRVPATDADDFPALGAAFEADRPAAVRHGMVGAAVTRLFPLAEAVAYAEQWLPAHRTTPHPHPA